MATKHEIKTKISGVTFPCPNTGVPRQKIIHDHVRVGGWLNAVAEPKNEHSSTAVALYLPGTKYHIGYLNERQSSDVFLALLDRKKVKVRVLNVTGGQEDKSYGVNIAVSWDDKVKSGCLTSALLLGVAGVVLAASLKP